MWTAQEFWKDFRFYRKAFENMKKQLVMIGFKLNDLFARTDGKSRSLIFLSLMSYEARSKIKKSTCAFIL